MKPSLSKTLPILLPLLLAGCGAAPTRPDHPAARGEALPLHLAVEMTPEQLAQTKQYYYYQTIYYEEGRLIHDAALAAFMPLVSQVLPRQQLPAPDVIVKVSGKSVFNPLMRVFYADVSATVYLPDGQELGTFQSSSELGGIVSGYDRAFEKAYIAAFEDIGRKLLTSGVLDTAAHLTH